MDNILMRHSAPSNKLDEAPLGTQCRVAVDKTSFDLYIQTHKNSETPTWDLIGNFPIYENDDTVNALIEKRLNY